MLDKLDDWMQATKELQAAVRKINPRLGVVGFATITPLSTEVDIDFFIVNIGAKRDIAHYKRDIYYIFSPWDVMIRQNWRCKKCHRPVDKDKFTIVLLTAIMSRKFSDEFARIYEAIICARCFQKQPLPDKIRLQIKKAERTLPDPEPEEENNPF